MSSTYQKTVIVLNNGSRFAISSGNHIPVSVKTGGNGTSQVTTAKKTLWSWTIESVLEYHRVFSDLFHETDRLLRIVVADTVAKHLQPSWKNSICSDDQLRHGLHTVRIPFENGEDCIPIAGLILAVDSLSQRTPFQEQHFEKLKKKGISNKKKNGGSIVVFCNLKSEEELSEIQKCVVEQVNIKNSIIADDTNSFAPIDAVDLYVINTYPIKAESTVKSFTRIELSRFVSCTVISRPAGEELISAGHAACMGIHDLVSTTVTGIPMKEEAQQGSSVNYDVELLHSRASHAVLESIKLCGENSHLLDKNRNLPYPTFKLCWSTPSPKNKWNLFPKTSLAVRVTPSAVNSRPSVCLTGFVMGGRTVMLEVKRTGAAENIQPNVNNKLISHTLISHAGRIYMHSIDFIPQENIKLTDTQRIKWPTIMSDQCDSDDDDDDEDFEPTNFEAIKDDEDDENDAEDIPETFTVDGTLRIDAFCSLMKECMLKPCTAADAIPKELENVPCGLALRKIRQLTRYWPLTKEDTLIFQTGKFDDIIRIFRQNNLTKDDIESGKKMAYRLLGLKTTKDPLLKGQFVCNLLEDPKDRDEQYRVAFMELASYAANYVNYSENHAILFKELMDILELEKLITLNIDDVPVGYDDYPLPENFIVEKILDKLVPANHSSRSSSPAPKRPKKEKAVSKIKESVNIYDLLCKSVPKIVTRRDFVGRESSTKAQAELYKNIDFSKAPSRGQEVPM